MLAGPGSGKTRVLVHRTTYLIRARRENARGILALAYNRHAAVDIRRRLAELIGDDARDVTVLTCHALAMRLAGASFTGRAERPDDEMFQEVMRRAVELLRGEGLPPEEADEQRERLLAGFRWILVDEYQDIGPDQYELISALARFAHHRTCRRRLKASAGGVGGFEAVGGVPGGPGPPESGATEPGNADSGRGSRWMAGAGQTASVAPVAARAAGGGWTVAGGVSRAPRGPAGRAGRRAHARTVPAAGSPTGRRSRPCGR